MTHYDLIVIGAGSGGIATANRAAEYGAKVAVIEAQDLGGTCVNRGCVPKKVSWYASRIHEAIHRYGPGYGFTVEGAQFDYQAFLAARDGYIERSRQGYINRFANNGITVIQGQGRFVDNQTVEVAGQQYTADAILIAVGGVPNGLQVAGHELLDNSDTFFTWQELPESVAVVGAGYIAVELAQVLHGLGVDTTLVVRHDRPLRTFDQEIIDEWTKLNEMNGPRVLTETDFDRYERNEAGQIVCYQHEEGLLTVDRVIQAVGRHPQTAMLGLEQTDVEVDQRGYILVDDEHATTAKGIYAVGDVIDKIKLTPVAIRAGRQLAEKLFNQAVSASIDYDLVPTVVFSHPPIGSIGLTEQQARDQHGDEAIKIYTNRFIAMYASAGGYREPCFFKLVTVGPDERVVGLHGIGEGVDEMIQGFSVAMKMGATKADFDAVVAIHPTGSEEFVTMR